ncbi:MAG: MBL fold metallo-hydrolase [Pirellulales bacterium]|nr:MBL fold metallo-hydrolase [Pirellulales bacterium]
MPEDLKITMLVDNTVCRADLLAEHGLACWIEADGHRVLFDTGQGRVLRWNARHLGVDLATTEAIVLSHGHFDHSGGLRSVLEQVARCPVFLHPAATQTRYSRGASPPHRGIGLSSYDHHALTQRQRDLVWTSSPTEVVPGVWVTGEIPRRNNVEDAGGPFFLDPECTQPDLLPDDQALYIETPQGTVVVLGCAHAGVANTLDYVSELAGGRPLCAVIGGLHMAKASPNRKQAAVEALLRHPLQLVAPAHCTGLDAQVELQAVLGPRWRACTVGDVFTFGRNE